MDRPFTCRDVRRHLSDYRDALPGAPRERIEAHLQECQRCAAFHRALEIGVRVLRAAELAPTRPVAPPRRAGR